MTDYNDSVLMGLKEICRFTRVDARTVRIWVREYPDVPIRHDGRYSADKEALREWQRRWARNEIKPAKT